MQQMEKTYGLSINGIGRIYHNLIRLDYMYTLYFMFYVYINVKKNK